jgi:hypothetical protein
MKEQTKDTLITGASILIASVGLFFIGKAIVQRIQKKAKDKREELLKEDAGGGTSSTQDQTEASVSAYNPTSDVNLISSYILGLNVLGGYPDKVNPIIMKLNNTDLKKLAYAWKKKYGRTLYYDLDDEWDVCGFWGLDNCYESSMNRLSNLNLR